MNFNSPILFPWWLKAMFFTRCLYFHHNWWKERGTTINSSNIFEGCYWGKKCWNSKTQSTINNLNIQTTGLLKIKLSHKLPSKQNYHLSKTFTFDNSNFHCLEASYSWACGSAGPNQSQVNEVITELWVSYSVKKNIPKHVANIAHIIWMTYLMTWLTKADC